MDVVKQYRVRPGFHHGVRSQYGPGDVVEMTPAEAAGFLDKLEPVSPIPDSSRKDGDGGAPDNGEKAVSKSALKWLEENQIELDFSTIEGTGKDGLITLTDVKKAAEAQATNPDLALNQA